VDIPSHHSLSAPPAGLDKESIFVFIHKVRIHRRGAKNAEKFINENKLRKLICRHTGRVLRHPVA
jgi:nitrous oxide reductase accessory protein NosL